MALTDLKQIYKDRGREFIENLFTKYVIVSEQLDGSRFTVMKANDNSLVYCKKDGSIINFIDRTMMVFYERAIEHFESLGTDVLIKMPDNWVFGFQYFPSLAPVNIVYDRLPKNNLILTDIQILNDSGRIIKTIADPRVLRDWAKIIDVENPPIIYNGPLNQLQKEKILEYLGTPEKDLMSMFNSQSFTRYIISVLNPNLRTSALMNDIDKPVEGIVFKFITPGESEAYSARLIDPIFKQHSASITAPVERKANDMYQISMLDIIEFMELSDIDSIQLNGESPDERYIELVSVLFNDYIEKNGHKYIGVDFETPDFAKKPEFDINLATIPNDRTREILKNTKLNDLFKIIISSFRRYRKNTTSILTQQIVDTLNAIINKIQNKVEMVPEENQVMDFNNYLKRSQIEGVASVFEKIITGDFNDINEDTGFKTFNTFISEVIVPINESAKTDTLTWDDSYDNWSSSSDVRGSRVKPKGSPTKGTGEVLRAAFGGTSVAETNIKSYLSGIGAQDGTFDISILPPGQGQSGAYYTYTIEFKKEVTVLNKFHYKRGDTFMIVDATKESKSGDIAVIGKKQLTPEKLGLASAQYDTAKEYTSAIDRTINQTTYPDNYKKLLKGLAESINSGGKSSKGYTNVMEFLEKGTGKNFEYKVDSKLFQGIDLISISNIANDFGEVLGGLHLFNIVKEHTAGVTFPTASNAELVDFIFDGLHISSKAGRKGGTPAASGIVKAVSILVDSGELTLSETEQDLYENVLKKVVDLSIFDFYNDMLINYLSGAGTPYHNFISISGLEPSALNKKNVTAWLYKLHEDKDAFIEFFSSHFKLCGSKPKDLTPESIYTDFDKLKDDTIFGSVFYPLVTTVVKYLNQNYSEDLTTIVNKSQDLAQLYLIFDIKNTTMVFAGKSFSVSHFKFEPKGSVNNPFNASIGITSGSVHL
jgi:hypothetical protein